MNYRKVTLDPKELSGRHLFAGNEVMAVKKVFSCILKMAINMRT